MIVTVKKYDVFELCVSQSQNTGIVVPGAVFTCGKIRKEVSLFWDGKNRWLIRFMPTQTGMWHYEIPTGAEPLTGNFICEDNRIDNHGPVETDGLHFRYADGTRYLPFGTTCYAWVHQTEKLQKATLESLKNSPFNKIRMCLFPKSMPYNNNDPKFYPFHKNTNGTWNIGHPDERFWRNLDQQIANLAELGIEADLILFHPYDRWGFSKFSREESLKYVEYCIARLAAYHNIWWSLANEYDVVFSKTEEDWDIIGETITKLDPYRHQVSIHNCMRVYPKRGWMTHASIQTNDVRKVLLWTKMYNLPVIVDECGYEGNIEFNWGNLSAFELVNRIWATITRGGYCTHGETFYREDEVLWWAKGGKLYGESPMRIAFIKNLLYSLPTNLQQYSTGNLPSDPNFNMNNVSEEQKETESFVLNIMANMTEEERHENTLNMTPAIIASEDFRLQYLGRACPVILDIALPKVGKYRVEVIDIWEMTRTVIADNVNGVKRVKLPGKEGMAIFVTRREGDTLN